MQNHGQIHGQFRRPLALVSGALLIALPLSSCGFDRATDRVNNIAQGVTHRDATLDVLNAVVVSAEQGSGTFIVTLVNNSQDEEASLEGLTPAGDAEVQVGEFTPISVPPGSLVNLAAEDQGGIPVEGDFGPGDSIPMTIQLSGGEIAEVEVPVVHNCYEYAGIDGEGGECEVAEPAGEH